MTGTFDVYVANIPVDIDEKKIISIFGEVGDIAGVKFSVSQKPFGNRICFVKYLKESDAECAAKYKHNFRLEDGTLLTVRYNSKNISPKSTSNGEANEHNGSYQNGFQTRHQPYQQNGSLETTHQPFQQNGKEQQSNGLESKKLMVVVHVESAISFYAQKVDKSDENILTEITNELNTLCSSQPKVSGQISTQQVYGCIFAEDGVWYRCRVEKILNNNMVQVRYIDFGNCEAVEKSSLVTLPVALSGFSPVALSYSLSGIELVNAEDTSELFIKGRETLKEIIHDKYVEISTENSDDKKNGNLCTIHSINKVEAGPEFITKLISTGAVRKKVLSEKVFNKSVFSPFSSSNNIILQKTSPKPEDLKVIDEKAKDLQMQLENAESEIKTLKSRLKELEIIQGKVTIQEKNLQEMHLLMKTPVTFCLQKLFKNVQNLRNVRAKFASGENLFPAQIQKMVDLMLHSHENINLGQMRHYQNVITTQSFIKEHNYQISNCTNKEKLQSLIEARDKAIKKLVHEIKVFLKHVALLPTAERLSKLKSVQCEINNQYKNVLENRHIVESLEHPTLESAVEKFETSTMLKNDKLNALQLAANEKSNKFYTALSESLRECHCVVKDVKGEVENIDNCIKEYEEAINEEINQITALEELYNNENVLSDVVIALEKSISSEILDIQILQSSLIADYEEMMEKYESILNNKPDTTNVFIIRKKLKVLKSKHRHLLADINDIEELEEKLKELRRDLHYVFVEELKEMRKLLNLYEDFPELSQLYPELHLDKFKVSNGLLQSSRSLEYYSHTPMKILGEKSKQTTYKSFFNNQPCVLKEVNIDEKFVTYTDVLSRLIEHEKLFERHGCQRWQKTDCLFKDRGERKLYIQTSYYEEGNIEEFIKKRKPNNSIIANILKQILLALDSHDGVYGSLKPNNIYVKNEMDNYVVVLGEPNFFETMERRMNSSIFVHKSILGYPVLDIFQELPSPQFDVVCFAGLALWMLYPDGPFSQNIHSDIEVIVQDGELKTLFRRILSLTPADRSTFKEILAHPFFANINLEREMTTEITNKEKDYDDDILSSDTLLVELVDKLDGLMKKDDYIEEVEKDQCLSIDGDIENDEKNNEVALLAWCDMLEKKNHLRKTLIAKPEESLISDNEDF
ncbi:serine/threonine-protein kinase 31 isoform X2 [Hydra vulgaris]|uniref:serine/threonine-protein kinase 31 isoform X2 n=2 Tax=Hydra vulgaris TaxID=6087 RepID=UPI001F5F8717|nr:serine/threonine-protein kinase 31-like isoform X2 [Hydra vulgaris]